MPIVFERTDMMYSKTRKLTVANVREMLALHKAGAAPRFGGALSRIRDRDL